MFTDDMVDKKTWQEFKDSGLLWWINMILHTFGWAIVFEISKRGKIINVYPARVKYRGFDMKSTENGYVLNVGLFMIVMLMLQLIFLMKE